MRVVLYNPHVDDFFAEPPHFYFLRRSALKKYGFFLSEEIRGNGCFYAIVDGSISAFLPARLFVCLPGFLRKWWAALEFRIWLLRNGLRASCVQLPRKGDYSADVLLAFSYKACVGLFSERKALFSSFRAVVFHLSHYFVATKEKADNISQVRNAWLGGDSDPSDNAYFKHFFAWYQRPFLVLPFAVSPRFVDRHLPRADRAVATGSFHDLRQEVPVRAYADYMSISGLTTYHPVRLEIFQRQEEISDLVKVNVCAYRNYTNGNRCAKWWHHYKIAQKKYFSIDIVDLYNQYKFAVVGEEYAGFPALGALESMSCGTVLLADPRYYAGLGLVPNVHFIPYYGNVDSLLSQIRQWRHKDVSTVARSGAEFVHDNFNHKIVYQRWKTVLQQAGVGDGQSS